MVKRRKRKKLKELGIANGSSREKKDVIPGDSYGSFFGPSQPVIAQRVIQESKSLLENHNLAARVIKSNQNGNKSSGSASSASKSQASGQRPKVTNGREDNNPTAAVNRMQAKMGSGRFASGSKPVRSSVDSRKHVGGNNGTLADHRKQLSSGNGSGPGRPLVSKSVPSKAPVGGTAVKKVSIPVARTSAPGMYKPNPSKLQAPVSKQFFTRKEEYPAPGKPKILPKQPILPPKPKQVMRPPPKTSARDTARDKHPRKRPVRHDDDDGDPENAISMIRNMFGYNPRRYEDVDDDSDMKANFDDIMREEERSAKIAWREDEEELLKIQEEDRGSACKKKPKNTNRVIDYLPYSYRSYLAI
ncbi:hypothetical protein ACH5RR_013920 [Cinchona calisaya]|uniref:Protein SPT2 homolog n=1 Tax=Cinchona calisaya TaxID=153742 RepID=A0ABD3A2W9_9GENT